MKKILIALAAMAMCLGAAAQPTVTVKGVVYNVDTLFHAKVGPGTTQTSLDLKASSNPLRVHYLTIDKTVPGVSLRTVCATNKVAGTARTSTMAQSNTKAGVNYFAGVNGDFFTTTGNATNGSSKVGSPTTSCTVDREIYKTSNSNYQFVVDLDGKCLISRLNYYTGTATLGEKVTLFKGVNVASPNNGITIYTPKYWGSTNQTDRADACWEVTAKIVDGDIFYAGGKFRLEVTSEPTSDGDTKIPSDGYVIHGRGTSKTGCNTGALNFVKALKPGDIVEFDNIILTSDGERIYPSGIVSGNPRNVGGGETLDTEGERTDASARHPRTCIGYSADGNTIIMMVIEGRLNHSVGVTTSMLADVMRYAGADEALNLDGGGSSTLYTQALGVRNQCTDGTERAVGNAIFAVLEAPEDSEVAELAFADWTKKMPANATYTPVVYAFNKYGKMISNDFKDYTLTCDAALGEIVNDGHSLYATGGGMHALTATYNGVSTSIAVTVDAEAKMETVYDEVLLDNFRSWTVQLHALVDREYMPIDAKVLDWSSSDANVATVDENGTVRGVADGECTITGVDRLNNIDVKVKVETVDNTFVPIFTQVNTDDWSISKTSLASAEIAAGADGALSMDYSMSSSRGPKFTVTNKIVFRSLPDAVRVRITPRADSQVASVALSVRANNQSRYVTVTHSEALTPGVENIITVPVSEFGDPSDIGIYPLEFNSIAVSPTGELKTPYHIDINAIEGVYNNVSGIRDAISISQSENALDVRVDGDVIYLPANASEVKVYDIDGRLLRYGRGVDAITAPNGHAVRIVSATIDGIQRTAKVVVK